MARLSRISFEAVLPVCLMLVMSERRADAYVDPGTASYVLQVVAGGLLAGVYLVRTYWDRVKEFTRTRILHSRRVDQ
jgi:hypothetical protein